MYRLFWSALGALGCHCVVTAQPFPAEIFTTDIETGFGSAVVNDTQPVISSLTDAAVIGDVNNDGLADFAAAGVGDDEDTWVFFGRPAGLPSHLPTTSLNATTGFRLFYTANSGSTGDRNAVGDVNGDGIDDFAVTHQDRIDDRVATVIYGGSSVADIDLESLNPAQGFHINDSLTYPSDADKFGINALGDVNADSLDDFLIRSWEADSEPDFSGTNTGSAFVVFGRGNNFPAAVDLDTLDGSNGFAMPGPLDGLRFAVSGGSAGDFNGDGMNDIVLGHPGILNSNGTTGITYVVFGAQGGFSASLNVADLDGSDGLMIVHNGIDVTNFGLSVAGDGDFNGDGVADVIIGAPTSDPFEDESNAGVAVVVLGNASNPAVLVADVTPPMPFRAKGTARSLPFYGADGEELGLAVALGDITNDGLAEAVAATPTASAGQGRIYALVGRREPDRAALPGEFLNGGNAFIITNNRGAFPGQLGLTGMAVGDVTGDGIGDLLMSGSTLMHDDMGNGVVYVLNGIDGDSVFGHGFEGNDQAR